MSETWPVNMISAFGRGETLALALQDEGFDVRIFDFTEALGPEWHRGAGPYPIATTPYHPKQERFLNEVRPFARGLTFWQPGGPLELGGPLSEYYAQSVAALKHLKGPAGASFEEDWLRRFLKIWGSPFHQEAWQSKGGSTMFPYAEPVGAISATKESRVMSFERFQTLELKYVAATVLRDIQFEGARITELEVESGRREAYRAPNWIWCLSSEETDRVGVEVAQHLFANKIRKAQWRWLSFSGRCHPGSWSEGFPEYVIAINDLHLPWVYANTFVLRWIDRDVFNLWMKVPAASCVKDLGRRQQWANEAREILERRLPQAGWVVNEESWSVCPHSPVFEASAREEGLPGWKNWDWIAPESLPRLDFSARLEKEAEVFRRLTLWRDDQLKKQGAQRDHALHAP